jgi:pyruvate formate lyase activating enzyme
MLIFGGGVMEPEGMIFDVKRYAIHDGPGIRTTVFLKGCPLRCPWCHNPEGISPDKQLSWRAERCLGCRACEEVCPRGAISFSGNSLLIDRSRCDLCGRCVEVCYPQALELVGERVTVAEIVERIGRDTAFYRRSGGGVTFSGGEPLMQPDFLSGVLRECRVLGIETAIDTSGYAEPAVINRISGDVNLFLWDIKMVDRAGHERQTGVSNSVILENLRLLAQDGRRIILRVAIIPGITDSEVNINQIGEFAASLGAVESLDLLPYHRAGVAKSRRLAPEAKPFTGTPPSAEAVCEIKERLAGFGLNVRVGG